MDSAAATTRRAEIRRKSGAAVRVNISLPEILANRAPDLLGAHGYLGLSDYVQCCLRRDLGMDFVRIK